LPFYILRQFFSKHYSLQQSRAEILVSGLVAFGAIGLVRATDLLLFEGERKFITVVHLSRDRPSTPFTDVLRREISLRLGEPFRGLVATVLGAHDGTLRSLARLSPREPVHAGQFEELLKLAAETGSSHDLFDLWYWRIPTLSEYGQGISRPLMFYVSSFLSSPQDVRDLNVALPRLANIDVLGAMGVRFVITDAELSSPAVTERHTLSSKRGAILRLYEIADANLGTYSPTDLVPYEPAALFAEAVRSNPGALKTRAYVSGPPASELSPARSAKLVFEKEGLRVTAASEGASALLLPVQFSHCYRLHALSPGTVTVERANLIHTLTVLSGNSIFACNGSSISGAQAAAEAETTRSSRGWD
jgi:hypothetical protein